ncbi:hypothetical protein [Archangium primigenium]|uniref:hypothetical protein n=1 Tax=[Archangium] primigenium TaxID=2792470 RepID=UPI00195B8BD3|nr:hypothetical protein [Archangium primigenium]MBM7116422.1 hypothetical protein [Archangium primigenium]
MDTRAPARSVLCGLFFFLGGAQPGLAQSSAPWDQSASACPATLANVRRSCGCEPREEAVFNSLAQTRLNSDNLRSHVTGCFKLDGDLNVDRLKVKGVAGLSGCLSKAEDQYPEYRQTLAELVAAAKNVPDRKLDIWLDCYGKVLGQGRESSRQKPERSEPTRARSNTATSTDAPRVKAQPGAAASTPASAPDIEQHIEADGRGRVEMEGMEAIHDGRTGSGVIRQSIKASGDGVITTGSVKARVGP